MAAKKRPGEKIKLQSVDELVKSIRHNGVLTPVLVRPSGEARYEMISGHRRMHAAKLAGMETIPAIIRELSDEDATIVMVDANLQREELLPSEKAFAFKMRLNAIRRKAGRPGRDGKMETGRNLPMAQKNSSQLGTNFRSDRALAEEMGESRNQIHRYIRLTELIPELLELVDKKQLPLMTAVEISYIGTQVQKYLYEYIQDNGMVKLYQVSALRQYLENEDAITQTKMIRLLNDNLPGRTQSKKVTLTEKKLMNYFPHNYTVADMEKIIMRLLDKWKAEQDGE